MRGTKETRTYPNRDKKRATKRKALRAKNRKLGEEVRKAVQKLRADVNIVFLNEEDEVVVVPRIGLFGHARSPAYRIGHEIIVGAVEDADHKELGGICTKLGVMVLAQAVGHHLAYGADGLARALAKWAGIDLEKLKEEADADKGGAGGGSGAGETAGEPPDVGPVDDGEPGTVSPGDDSEGAGTGGTPATPADTEGK